MTPPDTQETVPQFEDDTYTLSSGRRFYANRGIVGMSPEFAAKGDEFAEGYDGGEFVRKAWDGDGVIDWTLDERLELARYMGALWMQWATHQPIQQPTAAEREADRAAYLERANRAVQSAKRLS